MQTETIETTPQKGVGGLLTMEDSARYLAIGRSKIYHLASTGEIPSVRIGGSRRIRRADLDTYIESLLAQNAEVR